MPNKEDITQGHIVTSFSEDLANIRNIALTMGSLVSEQIDNAITSLTEGDVGLSNRIIKRDRKVDELDIRANEDIMRVLAVRQPVAKDLRLILALYKCVHELTSVGSKAKRMASFAIQLHTDAAREPRKKFLVHVKHMYDLARQMLATSLEALNNIDVQKAIKVVKDDDKLDISFDAGVRHLVTFMLENPNTITSALDMIFIFKALERVGDHACHIAEQVIFIEQGRDVRYLHPDVLG
ncbi:hypothetical protein TI03_05515 [Achromatium sp. WMS1]|nr:hypothetical protein TI03_05515 [Achromatium sp. WMS1]